MRQFFTFLLLVTISFTAMSQVPFTQGNLVILRVGDGTNALTNKGNALFLDEYTPAGVKVQSVAMPTTASGANNPIVLSGTATSEGALALSANGQFLAIAGYSSAVGASTVSLSTTTSLAVPRTIAIVKRDASINTSKLFTNYASASNPRAAYTSDGNFVWMVSSVKGVQYSTINSTDSAIVVSNKVGTTTVNNFRTLNCFDGQLFVSTSSGSAVRIGAVGTGLPTDTGKVITPIPGIPTTTGSPYAFWACKLPSSLPVSNVLYVTDDNANGAGGIKKYALNTLTGSYDSVGIIDALSVYRGLTGVVNGNVVTLYAVRNSDSLVTITDNAAYNAAPSNTTYTVLAAAPTGTVFRGVAFAPIAAPLATNNMQLTVTLENKTARLNWNIDNATEMKSFTVEKSNNGKDFAALQTIQASTNKNYSFTDKQIDNLTYYRINATKKDGTKMYSNVGVVKENTNEGIKLYPNPAKDFIVVSTKQHNETMQIELLNSTGIKLYQTTIPNNQTMVYIPTNNITSGVYFISYKINEKVYYERFVK